MRCLCVSCVRLGWRKMGRVRHSTTAFFMISSAVAIAILLYLAYQSQSAYNVGLVNNLYSEEERLEFESRKRNRNEVHIHKEDPELGHFGELDDHVHEEESSVTTVAIGCAITTRNLKFLNDTDYLISRIEVLRSFLPSFCKTASVGYSYHLYLSYDIDDPFFLMEKAHQIFNSKVFEIVDIVCKKGINVTTHYIQCSHSGHPAWAQAEAMWEAYLDNHDYYFRINDDTVFISDDWTKAFVFALEDATPTNVGVVGPKHRGGNEDILTYDFVHRTHLDIFGFYYPRLFTDWFADDWMTRLYQPDHALKLPNVRLIHTQQKGTRYEPNDSLREKLRWQVEEDQKTLNRYIKKIKEAKTSSNPSKKIISMSLYGHNPKYTFGAIRNAQLVPIIFPGWKMRVYIEEKPQAPITTHKYGKVPARIVKKLKDLNVEIIEVDALARHIAPMMWRYLVADDMTVDYFIVRDTDSRLSERDAAAVNTWIKTGQPLHCIRDHPSHAAHALSGGLIGGHPRKLAEKLQGQKWSDLMTNIRDGYMMDIAFLANAIWPRFQRFALCHDSVSCERWVGSDPYPVPRQGADHVGQVFDAFHLPRKEDVQILLETEPNKECGDVQRQNDDANKLFGFLQRAKPSPTKDAKNKAIPEDKVFIPPEAKPTVNVMKKKVVMWSMDNHISPIMDVKNLLEPAGVKVIDKSLAVNCDWTETCASDLRIIDSATAIDASPNLRTRLYEEYKNDAEMATVSHFICMKPMSMCEFFMNFKNKSIIAIATSRYEEGRYLADTWNEWNTHLSLIAQNKRNIIAANNKYDLEYLRYFSGLDPEYLPSYCGYVGATYSPSVKVFLLAPLSNETFQDYFLTELRAAIQRRNADIIVKPLRTVYPEYRFTHLARHPGIIHLPEQVSLVSMCEQYRMNIPLYFPSMDLLISWHQKYNILKDRTFNRLRKRMGFKDSGSPIKGIVDPKHIPDPNDESNPMTLRYWLRFADYYQWPHIIHFDTIDGLVTHLLNTNGYSVSHSMREFNRKLHEEILQKWSDILRRTL